LTIDLIENPAKPSLFKLLDEECMKKGSGNDNNLLKQYNNILSGNKSYKRPNKFDPSSFKIVHYAGEVEYEVSGFLEKNTDTVSDIVNDTLEKSKSSLVSCLFKKEQVEAV
jgi:myosin heavy subunit